MTAVKAASITSTGFPSQTPRRRQPPRLMEVLLLLSLLVLIGLLAIQFVGTRAESTFHSVGSVLGSDAAPGGYPASEATPDSPRRAERMPLKSDVRTEGGGAGGPQRLDRKIVYTADLSLIVKDFDAAQAALRTLISKFDGLIAQSDLGATSGQQRHGRWKLRVPVARYEGFLKEAALLGEPERNKLDSQDVTEEFFDVQARIKNKKVEEDRLVQLLKDATGKLTEILAVEKELSRVRGEIEQLQGRLNLLENLTSLTTVNITLREIKDYVPPTAPTYGTKLTRAFVGSWEALVAFGERLTLAAVALTPWLPLILLAALTAWWGWRVLNRGNAATTATSTTTS